VADRDLQPPQVVARWINIEQHVRHPDFLTSGAYRRELKGKRLLNLLWEHMRSQYGFPGDEGTFHTDLVKAASSLYGTDARFIFPDCEQLAVRIRTILGVVATP
jgi:hypothetical protein